MTWYTETLEDLLPDGWTVEDGSVIVCPDGHPIELDGECPDGHKSPLITMGLI
jgi:hypothetical protein